MCVYVEATNGQVQEVVNNNQRHAHQTRETQEENILSQHLHNLTFDPGSQVRGMNQSTPVSTDRVGGNPGAFLHETTLKSVAMEITLAESVVTESYNITSRGKVSWTVRLQLVHVQCT